MEEKSTARETPLTPAHRAAGARLVEFAGFLMPLQYTGIVDEHRTVRQAVGLFDVSHMGEVLFRGRDAIPAVDRLVTNDVTALADGGVLYSPICYPDGGIVDDCLVYRRREDEVLVVVNASNVAKDFEWLAGHTQGAVEVRDISDECALIALQGPRAVPIWSALAGEAAAQIPSFTTIATQAAGIRCDASRTGYTGEDGFEILCAPDDAAKLWQALLEAGAAHGIKPCGLGARDTLRLEARLPLYGNDIDASTTPLEAGLAWTVKLDAGDFIGRDRLVQQKQEGLSRRLVCLVMRSRGIARHGYTICLPGADGGLGEPVGQITSGTMSPTLEQAIALGYVPRKQAKVGTQLAVDVRGKAVLAEVVKGPFYKRPAA